MKSILIFLLLSVLFGRCTPNNVTPADTSSPDALIIRTGTSFGYCIGYCSADYVFNGTSVTLTQNSHSPTQNPTKTCQTTISQADWNTLKAAANLDTFGKQPETLGCPDCADGGAEYVELQISDQTHRVTFDYGKTIPGFETLVNTLRARRAAFKACR